jgi:hypothetical protein
MKNKVLAKCINKEMIIADSYECVDRKFILTNGVIKGNNCNDYKFEELIIPYTSILWIDPEVPEDQL